MAGRYMIFQRVHTCPFNCGYDDDANDDDIPTSLIEVVTEVHNPEE